MSRLMGNLVLTNKKAQFVLTHKLLLQQYQHPVRYQQKHINIKIMLFLNPLLKHNILVFGLLNNSRFSLNSDSVVKVCSWLFGCGFKAQDAA